MRIKGVTVFTQRCGVLLRLTDTSLETVVGEAELGEPLEPPNVRREGAEVVGAEGEDGDVGAVLEQLPGQERVGVAPRGGYVVEVQLHEVERPVNKNNKCLYLNNQ